MHVRRFLFGLAMLAGAQLGASAPARALSGLTLVPSSVLMLGTVHAGPGCQEPGGAAQGSPALHGQGGTSKSQAILGGQLSRLEMIARQQGAGAPSGLASPPALDEPQCQPWAKPSAVPMMAFPSAEAKPAAPDDFLASKRLPVRRTAFDAQWRRVSQGAMPRRALAALGPGAGGSADLVQLAAINRWTNDRVRFVDDRVQYGRADYWASAQSTLKRGAGDCEDIAIAKLQLLAAAGVPRGDMYLTIARDLARNADHAMLVVRMEGRFWLLDNATNEVLEASQSFDYRPILSYSDSGKWLHGY